jgi:polysaccharide export outer membrane protein
MKTALLLFLALQVPPAQQPPPTTTSSSTAAPPEYLVGPQDKLDIAVIPTVFSASKVTVEPDGQFQYLNLGRIQARDLTVRQIAAKVKDLLMSSGQHTNPTVMVEVTEFRSQTIFVQGDGVKSGGSFRLQGNDTLQAAIFMAGSFTSRAGPTVTVTRRASTIGERPAQIQIPRKDIENGTGAAATFRLHDQDIITVPEAGRVIVQGEVRAPGAYDINEDTKIVLDFINLAGGFTAKANKGSITITRTKDGKPDHLKVNKEMTTPIAPNDVIEVKARKW